VANVNAPFALIVRLSPPLSYKTSPVPDKPETVPPTVKLVPELEPEPAPAPDPDPDPGFDTEFAPLHPATKDALAKAKLAKNKGFSPRFMSIVFSLLLTCKQAENHVLPVQSAFGFLERAR